MKLLRSLDDLASFDFYCAFAFGVVGDNDCGLEAILVGDIFDALLLAIGTDVLVEACHRVERIVAGLRVYFYRARLLLLLEVVLLVAVQQMTLTISRLDLPCLMDTHWYL
jgi:hypothetical protein